MAKRRHQLQGKEAMFHLQQKITCNPLVLLKVLDDWHAAFGADIEEPAGHMAQGERGHVIKNLKTRETNMPRDRWF